MDSKPKGCYAPITGQWGTALSAAERDVKWDRLEEAFGRVAADEDLATLSFNELYTAAHALVSRGHGDFLYMQTQNRLSALARNLVETLKSSIPNLQEFTLRTAQALHNFHCTVSVIADILLYMDKNYCRARALPTTLMVAAIRLRTSLFQESDIGKHIVEAFVAALTTYRRDPNYAQNVQLIQAFTTIAQTIMAFDAVSVVVNPDFFHTSIQIPILAECKLFYESDIKHKLNSDPNQKPTKTLLIEIRQRLDSEPKHFGVLGLDSENMLSELRTCLRKIYVDCHFQTLLSRSDLGLMNMIRKRDVDLMRLLYSLGNETPTANSVLIKALTHTLTAMVTACCKIPGKARACTDAIKELSDAHHQLITDAAEGSAPLMETLTKAMSATSRETPVLGRKLAGALNEFLWSLESSGREENVEELRNFVKDYIDHPFAALQDHDVFEFSYRQGLVKRFLDMLSKRYADSRPDDWGKETTEQLENYVTQTFINSCGPTYMMKILNFFDDLKTSESLHSSFSAALAAAAPTDLRTIVLASHQWIDSPKNCLTINFEHRPDLYALTQGFDAFYVEKLCKRRLTWLLDQGRAIVRFHITADTLVDIICSTIQMIILTLFNEYDQLTWGTICKCLRIAPDNKIARRHFIGLWGRSDSMFLRPLEDVKLTSEFKNEDAFIVNSSYTSNRRRVLAPIVAAKGKAEAAMAEDNQGEDLVCDHEAATGPSGLPFSLERDRGQILEAALVRKMKAEREMSHNDLMTFLHAELEEKAGFVPSPALVKDRIGDLLRREFIRRDPRDRTIYHYVM